MPDADDIAAQWNLLRAHRATLAHYLLQRAQLGTAHAPPAVANGIADARAEIRRCKAILSGWGEAVEDHPDDEEQPATAGHVLAPASNTTAPLTARITLLLEGDVQQFTPEQQAGFVFVLARVVNVRLDQIRIVHLGPGSVRLTLDMPEDAARRLAALYAAADPSLEPLRLLNVEVPTDEVWQVVGRAQETYRNWVAATDLKARDSLRLRYQTELEQLWHVLADDLLRVAASWTRTASFEDLTSKRTRRDALESLAMTMFLHILESLPQLRLDPHHDMRALLLTVARRNLAARFIRARSAVPGTELPAEQVAPRSIGPPYERP